MALPQKVANEGESNLKFEKSPGNKNIARALIDLKNPDYPLPVGVFI